MKIITGYEKDDALRASLNALVRAAFGFDFEGWYNGGMFTDKYRPYSLYDGERIVANVSANIMTLDIDEKRYNAVQIGTVTTAEDCRSKGYAAQLMKHVVGEYKDKCDFMYLFANDSAKEFYPRFGFTELRESYRRGVIPPAKRHAARKLEVVGCDFMLFKRLYENHVPCGRAAFLNNFELLMFYCGGPLADSVYYIEDMDAAVIVERREGFLQIMDVFASKPFALDEVIASVEEGEADYVLGFSPLSDEGLKLFKEPFDSLFMSRDMGFGDLYFPVLSRA